MFRAYEIPKIWDELFEEPGLPRPVFKELYEKFTELDADKFIRHQKAAEESLHRTGITFNVYGNSQGNEKIMPFDLLPRIIDGAEWNNIEQGLIQRIQALNLFIQDIYSHQKILKDGIIPTDLVLGESSFRQECMGLSPPRDIWIHITGTDLIRDSQGRMLVLEDNLRCPSGVSYVLENRFLMKRIFPMLLQNSRVRKIEDYPQKLFEALEYIAPDVDGPLRIGILTPGVYNSAYFEHSFLARQMGVELCIGDDLAVIDDILCMKTTDGYQPIHVLYRRIDDDFLDPEVFRPDSYLGVKGLMRAYRKGNIGLANAPGTGVADDKATYAYVPNIIKYYLNQDPILPNVQTYLCSDPSDRSYVLEHLDQLVVKATNESGGYGMLMGHQASKAEREDFARKIKANPRRYIAQPVVQLSQAPTLIDDHFEGRRVDLRPYVVYGKSISVTPGGLTRVALKKDSLVVNSSQGGGSKDTWVVDREVR